MRNALVAFVLFLTPLAFAAGRELAPRPLIETRDDPNNLAIAAAGGRFLAAWNAGGNVYGAILDANGHRISPFAFLIAESEFVDDIEVVGTGDSFAVFWIDFQSVTHLTDVALDGRVLRTRTTALPKSVRLSAAWDGERFLAVLFGIPFRPNASRAVLLDRDGSVVHDAPLTSGTMAAHIAVVGDGFVAFTATPYNSFTHRVTRDGETTQIHVGDFPQTIASVALDDHTLLAVTATADGTMRSAVWKDDVKVREQIVATQHLGGIRPVAILRGNGRHLLAIANGREGRTETMVLDDDGMPLSEPATAGSTTPAVAGASNGSVLVVQTTLIFVESSAFDLDGTITATETLSIHPAGQSHALIGAGGGAMLAAWNEATPHDGTRVRTAVVDRDFEPQNVRELVPRGVLSADRIAWNGTEHLIVYETDGQLFAARVSYDGNPIGEPALIADAPDARASVAWAGDRWAIAWTDSAHEDMRYATVSWGGVPSAPRTLRLTANRVVDVVLAFDGSRVHLAWIETFSFSPVPEDPRGFAVFTTRLRRDGRVVDATPLAIPSAQPNHLAIAASDERVLLLVDEETRAALHVIGKSRQLLSTRTLVEQRATSDVTWDGYAFAAASLTDRTLTVWRLGRDAGDLDDVRATATLAHDYNERVSIAASPSYGILAALQETDAALGARAVLYPSREMPRP